MAFVCYGVRHNGGNIVRPRDKAGRRACRTRRSHQIRVVAQRHTHSFAEVYPRCNGTGTQENAADHPLAKFYEVHRISASPAIAGAITIGGPLEQI